MWVALLDRSKVHDLLLLTCASVSVAIVILRDMPIGLLFVMLAIAGIRFPLPTPQHTALLIGGLAFGTYSSTQFLGIELVLGSVAVIIATFAALTYTVHTHDNRVSLLLLAGTAMGIYVNVPDTEQIAAVGTGLTVLLLGTTLWRSAPTLATSPQSIALLSTLLITAGALGARGRPSAFIGVVGALGVLLVEPVAARLRPTTRSYALLLIIVHIPVVLVASRIAGRRDVGAALLVTSAALLVSLVVLVAVRRRSSTNQCSG